MSDEDKIDFSMFLDDYISDAREGFQRVNTALIALERDNSRTEGLDDVFRVVHTLKSSSTMLEFSDIAELAHICEDLLERLRKKDLPVTQGVIDLLFEVTDTLEAMVKRRAERKSESAPSWGPRIAEIKGKITAQSIGKVPMRQAAPDIFEELVERYGNLMDPELDQGAFGASYDTSESLRTIAGQLGFLRAGPRDVVEIHSAALKRKTKGTNPKKTQAYVEEVRLMVLELMGYLVSYYRTNSIHVGMASGVPNPVKMEGSNHEYVCAEAIHYGGDAPVSAGHLEPAPDLRLEIARRVRSGHHRRAGEPPTGRGREDPGDAYSN